MTRWLPGLGFKRPLHAQEPGRCSAGRFGPPVAARGEATTSSRCRGRRAHGHSHHPTFAHVQDAFDAGIYDGLALHGSRRVAKDANPDRSAIILAGDEASARRT